MKKLNLGFIMVGLVFLISISVLSCQANDTDDYSQQAEDMTAADLFIASEAHQNLEKEIRKNMRRMLNAISKFSKEEMEQYQKLKKELLNMETRSEAKIQWNKLLGYDYYASLYRLSNLVREVYEGTDFTRLELMRARQKRKMHQVVITRTTEDDEAIQNYWDMDWVSLGKQIADDFSLTFHHVPQNALLLLRDLTRGTDERIFLYEDAKQIWY